jgi:hypothetical protein
MKAAEGWDDAMRGQNIFVRANSIAEACTKAPGIRKILGDLFLCDETQFG